MTKRKLYLTYFLNHFGLLAILTLLFVFSCSTLNSPPKVLPPSKTNFQSEQMSERISAALKPQIGTKNIGALIAIYNKGKVQYLSFGETSRGNKTPPDADTLFEIGSITKTFTGLMFSRSIELKRVQESDTLDLFRPEWKGQKTSGITLLELITHKSGLPRVPCNLHYTDPRVPYFNYTEEDLINGLTDHHTKSPCELKNHPTHNMHYSNWGVATLGYVLSSQQKITYEKLLEELVTDPLGLNDTTIKLSGDQKTRMAKGYDNDLHENPYWDHQVMYGAGAIKSSGRDLIKYAKDLLHPEETSFSSSLKRSMSYSWFSDASHNLWHDGLTGGFSSFIKIYPEQDLAIIYLSNTARPLHCFIEAVEDLPCKM